MAGFAELYLQNTQEGFRPRLRINTKKSETELKDDELQRKLNEEMKQGLVNRDVDFTAPDAGSCLKSNISGFDITFNSGEHCSWQDVMQDQSHQNFNHIVFKRTAGRSSLSGNMGTSRIQQSFIICSRTSVCFGQASQSSLRRTTFSRAWTDMTT